MLIQIKNIILIIIFILLILGGFYWFQYRPTQIRSFCDWDTKRIHGWRITKTYDEEYNSCLHSKGLN